jgi:hypothetical protein
VGKPSRAITLIIEMRDRPSRIYLWCQGEIVRERKRSRYYHGQLSAMVEDADVVAAALESVGYTVSLIIDGHLIKRQDGDSFMCQWIDLRD